MGDIDYWVSVLQQDYLPNAEYEGDDSIALVEERAIESLVSELRSRLQDAEREWWQQTCTVCDGDGTCLVCEGGRWLDDDQKNVCETCEGTGMCPHCGGSALEHNERN